jgi:spore maturation protein CgeB
MVMIDEKTKFGNFFNNNEIILYKNINDLAYKIDKYTNDNKTRKKIAKKGRDKYFKYFNSTIVAEFIIEKALGLKNKKYYWNN